ncbi:hypothetical protein PR048_014108 [Dryococelus australis]|uniref:Uncharacterized protein n=1 Tax=Dryococelus australis TaxID=614101 RepID=A0ABQ9HDQ1_9NEOP|nr:hypothetical protein PR048_014108 [Dryococelus australis]
MRASQHQQSSYSKEDYQRQKGPHSQNSFLSSFAFLIKHKGSPKPAREAGAGIPRPEWKFPAHFLTKAGLLRDPTGAQLHSLTSESLCTGAGAYSSHQNFPPHQSPTPVWESLTDLLSAHHCLKHGDAGISCFPALLFQHCSLLISITLIGSQDPEQYLCAEFSRLAIKHVQQWFCKKVFLCGQEKTASDMEVHAHTSGSAAGFNVTVSPNCSSPRLATTGALQASGVLEHPTEGRPSLFGYKFSQALLCVQRFSSLWVRVPSRCTKLAVWLCSMALNQVWATQYCV